MDDSTRGIRWSVALPAVAAAAAVVMVAFAWVAARSARDRALLALDGRILGVAHRVELAVRDEGLDGAGKVLNTILREHRTTLTGLRLERGNGDVVAEAGRMEDATRIRAVTLFVGPAGWGGGQGRGLGPGGPPSGGPGPFADRSQAQPPGGEDRGRPLSERRGRGRFVLRIGIAAGAGRPPLPARLIVPVAALAGLGLLALALLAGRLLERQRLEVLEAARRRRLEELGRAGAGLAHQLRTPLATIKGSCQMLAEEFPGPGAARRLAAALDQVERMERMLGLLLDFARPPQPQPETFPLGPLFDELSDRWDPVRVRTSAAPAVHADREHVVQILENLIANALSATDGRGPVEIRAAPDGPRVQIVVADRGPGPGDDPEALFEPYVTGRADGSGLGLPIARNLALANGGTLKLRPREGGGTEAVLELPAAKEVS